MKKGNLKGFNDYVKETNEYDTESGYRTFNKLDDEDTYFGTRMLKELADMLGVEVTGNGINYKGVDIDFFSETEKIHIGKETFSDPKSAYEWLMKNSEVLSEKLNIRKR